MTELAPMLEALETLEELPPGIWHEWLWGTDPEEPCHIDVLLNRNHLLGLLVCRCKFLKMPPPLPAHEQQPQPAAQGLSKENRMTIMDTPVHAMSWRELKDTVANVLFEWPAFLDRLRHNIRAKQNMRQVMHLVNQCAARFGELACTAAGDEVLDDPSETQPATERAIRDQLTRTPARSGGWRGPC